MATFAKVGYGQVEPNHLSAPRTGQIYAQLPWVNTDATGVLENGTFKKYDMAAGYVNDATGAGEWMLVYNEEKLYEVGQFHADFAMKCADAVDGVVVPRLFKTNIGDIFTTNMVKDASGYVAGATVTPGTTGVLEITSSTTAVPLFKIAKLTTMPDGKPAVKLQRIL